MAQREDIEYTKILNSSSSMSSYAKSMENKLNEVKAKFNKIGDDSVWGGLAADKNKQEFDKLSAQFPKFHQSVEDASKFLTSTVNAYKEADKALTK